MWYIAIIIIIAVIFVCFRNSKYIENKLPWIWKNIGQPIFNHYFVLSVRKVTMKYFAAVVSLNVALPLLEFSFDKNHNFRAAFNFNGTGFDWFALSMTALITIAYALYIKHENKKLNSLPTGTLDEVVKAVTTQVGRGSLEIVKNLLPEIGKCLKSLHVNTAYGLLEKLRTEVDNARMPDWSLLSRIDYLMGACKRYTDKELCNKHYLLAFEEMEKAGMFDKEIVCGRIFLACRMDDLEVANKLAGELKGRDKVNIWAWIPTLLESESLKEEIASLPSGVANNDKLYAELLSMNRQDILEAQDALSLTVPELKVMTLDDFVLWSYWLSVALTQFVSTWKMGINGGCEETESSKKILSLSEKYLELLHQTELPNVMPDIEFVHTFAAFLHDHCPQRIEEIGKQKPSETLKELYYLAYASMLQSGKRIPEALEVLASYDGYPSISVQNARLQIAVLNNDVVAIENVFKKVAEDQILIPKVMMSYFCASLHICADKVAPYVRQLRFENDIVQRIYFELFNFQTGNEVDIEFVKEHEGDIPKDMIAYLATMYQKYGLAERAIGLLEPILSDTFFDYRNYAYIGLLQSDKKYNSKLYAYLGQIREKGVASDDLMQMELMMSERMMDFERSIVISSDLIKRHPENGILMEHHLMALYRNKQNDEIERLYPSLKGLQFPETSVQNIFNIYLIIESYEKAIAFLYDEIQKNNSQTLRDFFFQVHAHKEIDSIIMKQYDVVAIDSYVMLDVDGKEEYTDIRPGSYLEDLIGKKAGEEITYKSVNKDIHVFVKAIFNRYFKLMKEVMDEIAKHQSKTIRSFSIEDLEGGEGILANLAKISGSVDEVEAQAIKEEEAKMMEMYQAGQATMYYFINQHQLFAEMYKLLFGVFRVKMIPTSVVKHFVQVSELNVAHMKPVLDLSSLLLIHELQLKYGLELPCKMIIPRCLQVAVYDASVREKNSIPSFISDQVTQLLTIVSDNDQEPPLLSKLNMLLRWIDDYCEVFSDDSILNDDIDKLPNDMSVLYMQSVKLANQPDRLLITEDWTATQINFKAYPAMSTVNWLSVIGVGDEKKLNMLLSKMNYLGCSLDANYIFEQYVAKKSNKPNNFATCIENIEYNPYNATAAFSAGNLMLSGITTAADHMVVVSMFASVFKNLDYQQSVNILNMAMRMYRNSKYQQCLMRGFKDAHPIIM